MAAMLSAVSGGGDGFEAYYTIHGGTGKVLAQNIEKQVIKIGQNSRGCKTRQGQRGDYYAFVPAMLVAMVTAPYLPACATISASRS